MSISLYCGSCGNYQGHLNPSHPRDYAVDAETRRERNFMCRQCEAEKGLYDGRIHARDNWNLSMRGHRHIMEDCKKTIRELGYSDEEIGYEIGKSGYTVMTPKKKHSAMLSKFTDQDALCLLELEKGILFCDNWKIRDYRISKIFAEWIALMRHVECSKMTRAAVGDILMKGINDLKEQWPGWSKVLVGSHIYFLTGRPIDKQICTSHMKKLGQYLSSNLNRTNAEGKSSNSKAKAYSALPSTPSSVGK